MTSEFSTLDPDRLIKLLENQRDLYVRLRELSDQQRAMISGDRPELLLDILRQRQDLVTALARLNDDLGPFRRNWDAMYAALPDGHRQRAASLLEEVNALLRGILRTDQEDGALLSARKQAVAAELAGVSGGQAANAAYARHERTVGSPSAADITG